ncbi:MAG: hypothetical protein AAF628_04715 [Planctomycetota bacterium]
MLKARSAALFAAGWFTACATPPSTTDAVQALQNAAAGPLQVELQTGGALAAAGVPVAVGDLPRAVSVAIDTIQPGGEPHTLQRVIQDGDELYRSTKRYVDGDATSWRSVLLDGDGTVRERSHSLPRLELPASVAAQIERAVRGAIQRVDAVQGDPGAEWFRAYIRHGDARWVVDCTRGGAIRRRARILTSELWVAAKP